jgi:micrococcal nuclease
MRAFHLITLAIILFFLIVACSTNDKSQSPTVTPDGVPLITATVTNVVDGDTIDVMINNKEERVRLLLIDTPETKHPSKPIQPFGPEAFEFTERILLGKKVGLEKDVSERDRFGRILAYVWLDDHMHNETLIEKGLARVATFPPDIKYVERFKEKQHEAQNKGVGIWSLENYSQEKGFQSDLKTEQQDKNGTIDNDCVGKIKGNKNSKIYHLPDGVHYEEIANHNIVWFCTEAEAQDRGYRKSKN